MLQRTSLTVVRFVRGDEMGGEDNVNERGEPCADVFYNAHMHMQGLDRLGYAPGALMYTYRARITENVDLPQQSS